MKLLLDTHAFLWVLVDDAGLSATVRREIMIPENEVLVSVASLWEISIKYGLGRLPLPQEPDRYLPAKREAAGIGLLTIDEAEVCQIHRLPPLHRDPFDRLLIAQANCYGLVIATNDPVIGRYPVRTIW